MLLCMLSDRNEIRKYTLRVTKRKDYFLFKESRKTPWRKGYVSGSLKYG